MSFSIEDTTYIGTVTINPCNDGNVIWDGDDTTAEKY